MSDENQNHQIQIVNSPADCVADATEAAKEILGSLSDVGLPTVPKKALAQLNQLGIDADDYALMAVARGAVIMTAPAALELLDRVVGLTRKKNCSDQKLLQAGLVTAALCKAIQGVASTVNAAGLAAPKPKDVNRKKKVLGVVTSPVPQATIAA